MAQAAEPGAGRRAQAAGLTLIEVLVALAILAVALAAAVRASAALLDNADRLAEVQAAQWCADNRLAELRLSQQFPGTGELAYECRQLGRVYRLAVQVAATPNPNFRRLEAQVRDAEGRPILSLSTVLGRY